MTARDVRATLMEFATTKQFKGKGALSVALVGTDHAKKKGLPLDPNKLLTAKTGQVLGLGGPAVQGVLRRHGITRILASEGGRTSRGSLENMRDYVTLLNLLSPNDLELDEVERFWIERVQVFFAGKPFKLRLDASRSLRTVVRDLIEQAQQRQVESPGMQCAGAVLQHLVGAKLGCAMGVGAVAHNSFSTADAPSQRPGDFFIGNVSIHVTTAPGEAVIRKCKENIDDGLRPILVTLQKGLPVAEGLASNFGLADRVDIFEVEQFIALNLYELGKFEITQGRVAVLDLVKRYNEIIEEVETDPGLRIEIRT